jgi:hypothetical protein
MTKADYFLFWLADRTFGAFLLMRIWPIGDGSTAGDNLAELLQEAAAFGRWLWSRHPGRRATQGKGWLRRLFRHPAATA